MLVIDPVARCVSLLGHFTTKGSKWNHAVSSPLDGKVYGLPFDASQLLVIDPERGTTSTAGNFGGAKYKWRVGVLAPDGRIFGIPYNHEAVLVIDPAAGGVTTLLPLPPAISRMPAKWNGGVLGNDGCIYAIPCNATAVLRIDPRCDGLTLFGECGKGPSKWRNGVLDPRSGAIFAAPFDASGVLMIDPTASTIRVIGALGAQKGKWADSALGGDGQIYACPHTAHGVLVFDPSRLTCTTVGNLTDSLPPNAGSKMCGAYVECLSSGGAVVGVPVHATSALIITPAAVPPSDPTPPAALAEPSSASAQERDPEAAHGAGRARQPPTPRQRQRRTGRLQHEGFEQPSTSVAPRRSVSTTQAPGLNARVAVSSADASPSPCELRQAIAEHLSRTDLIYGWEAARRTCIGAARAPLRSAAHRARAASDVMRAAASPSGAIHDNYCASIERLFELLRAAGESDFDGLLREAVDGLLLSESADVSTAIAPAIVISSPLTASQARALERIRSHRYHGSYKGKAAARDLRRAIVAAEDVRAALAKLASAPPSPSERADATEAYVRAVDRLREEAAIGGELDMDGLLRQAVQLLDFIVDDCT